MRLFIFIICHYLIESLGFSFSSPYFQNFHAGQEDSNAMRHHSPCLRRNGLYHRRLDAAAGTLEN